MIGKRGVAPCGHDGEYYTPNYVRCLKGCDSKPAPVEVDWDSITLEIPRCVCGSIDIDEDFELDPLYYVFNPGTSVIADTRCNDCGRCWCR